MTAVRVAWFAIALISALLTIRFGFQPVTEVSSTCSKGGSPDEFGAAAHATCQDSTATAFGVVSLVQLGLLLTVPPIVAGLVMRWWVSWLMVAVLAGLSIVGVLGANGFWVGLLIVGAPVTALGVVTAAAHVGLAARKDSLHRDRSTSSINNLFSRE